MERQSPMRGPFDASDYMTRRLLWVYPKVSYTRHRHFSAHRSATTVFNGLDDSMHWPPSESGQVSKRLSTDASAAPSRSQQA